MGEITGIEWTDSTWNPLRARNLATGKIGWHCEHMSEACRFCYAESMNRRLGTGLDFKPGHRADIEIFLDENMLLAPLRWKKPRHIFVNSMTDTFADFVKDEWLDRMFAVMALAPRHTFQVLTKRPERMLKHLTSPGFGDYVEIFPWPLPNVWLGTSAEDQATADERIPLLLQTQAQVRFVSLEPLLGAIDLASRGTEVGDISWLRGFNGSDPPIGRLDWVIAGGESGKGARPSHPDWFHNLRDQCAAAGVSFFFKQWGEWAPFRQRSLWSVDPTKPGPRIITYFDFEDRLRTERVGKKLAGRLLDGVEHNGMPGAP